MFPLAFGVATPVQAVLVAGHLRREFLRPGGLLTTPWPAASCQNAPTPGPRSNTWPSWA
ncbi:MAG: hypothetical protein WKG07_34855 [Hymenobacter sp.]